jgi:hypothetical protein
MVTIQEGLPMLLQKSRSVKKILLAMVMLGAGAQAYASQPMEVYCTIRPGGTLNCQTMGKERRVMTAEDITNFVDAGEVAAYITLKSRKNIERVFMVDGKSPQYKRLNDLKKTASMSEIAKAKSDLFNEIEKKVIKLSDELDGQAAAAELVLYDSGITYDKIRRENRSMLAELESYRKNREKVCTETPAFAQVSRANQRLQQTLSNMLTAFQAPDTCMSEFKVFRDKDGAVDLRQLDGVAEHYRAQCKRK